MESRQHDFKLGDLVSSGQRCGIVVALHSDDQVKVYYDKYEEALWEHFSNLDRE